MNLPDFRQQAGLSARAAAPRLERRGQRVRNALRVSFIMLGAAIVLLIYNLYTAFLNPVWQHFVIAGVCLVTVMTSVVGVWLSRRGRYDWSAWFAVGEVLFMCLAGALLFKGLGYLVGLAVVILTAMIAGQMLFQRQAARAVATGVLAGLLALFIELTEPAWRIPAVSPTTATIIAVALVLIFGVVIVRQFTDYALRSKLIIAFLVVSLVPLGLSFYLISRTTSSTLTVNRGANLKTLAESKALAIGDQLAQQVDMLRLLNSNKSLQYAVQASESTYPGDPATILAQIDELDRQWRAADAANNDADPLVKSRLNSQVAVELRDYAKIFPGNVEVLVTDRYGALVAASKRTTDYYQADEEWWQAAWNNGRGATFIGQPVYDENSGTFVAIIAVSLYSTEGDVAGVIATTWHMQSLAQSLAGAGLGRTGRAELYLPAGQVLTVMGGQASSDPVTLGRVQAISGDYAEFDYAGTPSLVSRAPVAASTGEPAVSRLGWLLVVHQDQDESLAPIQTQNRYVLLLALAVAGLVAIGGIAVAQVLASPIARLTAVATQVAQGNLNAQAAAETQDEVGALAGAFNTMVAELRQTLASLEDRVAERTRELERRVAQIATAGEVSRAAATVRDPEQLVTQVVELVQARFGYYYVGLFMIDADRRYAVLWAGSGEAGRIMKERGHRLEVGGQSMVGWTCAHNQARIALDVGDEPMRFDNPLLPATRSEMALPLRVVDPLQGVAGPRQGTAGRVIGALDVQSTQAAAFDQGDIAALQGLADQIGVALENARLFREAQDALSRLDEANRLLVHEGWQDMLTSTQGELHAEFVSEGSRAADASGPVLQVPLELRGQTLGTLVMERGEGGPPWTDDEAEAIRAIVQQAALALDGARLFEETQRRAARERLINEITARIRSSVTIEGVLNAAVREIGRATGSGYVEVDLTLAQTE